MNELFNIVGYIFDSRQGIVFFFENLIILFYYFCSEINRLYSLVEKIYNFMKDLRCAELGLGDVIDFTARKSTWIVMARFSWNTIGNYDTLTPPEA